MKLTLLLFVLAVFFICCTKQTKPNGDIINCFPVPDSISLELNNCAEKTTESYTPPLCFEQLISDSRCPANVVCVWSGVAIARFSFRPDASTRHQLTLATQTLPGYSSDTSVSGYRIKLLNITPYPGTTTTPQPVRAILKISR